MNRLFYISFFVFLFVANIGLAQEPAIQENKAGFKSEWFGGLNVHTLGWGVTLSHARFDTYKKYSIFNFDFITQKHPKEFKVLNTALQSAKGYKYGKLNVFLQTRVGYGKRYMIFEKFRDKGVEIYAKWLVSANIGILKPVYLEILKFDQNGNAFGEPVSERYDPEIHNELNIFGKSSSFKGIDESAFVFGGSIKGSLTFEFANDREKILALETGLVADIYPQKVPIMAIDNNQQVFINLFINILFGRKYYN